MRDTRSPAIDRRSILQGTALLPLGATFGGPARAASAGNGAGARDLSADPLRPSYHFLPPSNWMNDPNGPIYWQGNYHLFYQYNPKAPVWGSPNWGHARSRDLVHWQHQPIALAPTPGGPDADGVFSGTAIADGKRVHFMYTGVRATSIDRATIKDAHPPLVEAQCLATATDDSLTTWTKRPAPVIAAPPEGLLVNGFRDPSPWRQGDAWYAVVGSGIAGHGGAILLYRSTDLVDWQFVRIFARRDAADLGAIDPWEVWECPDFFALGDRHVLIFSTAGKAFWQSGQFDADTMTFRPERSGILDYGTYYAPKTQLDAQGNRILWGWVNETRAEAESRAAGWAGLMALPRVLTLDPDGELVQQFFGGFERLRGAPQAVAGSLPADLRLDRCCAEGEVRWSGADGDFTVEITDASNSQPWLTIAFRADQPKLIYIEGRPLEVFAKRDAARSIRFYMDGSVIEASANGRAMWTRRFYYDGARRDGVLRLSGAAGRDIHASVWPLKPARATAANTGA